MISAVLDKKNSFAYFGTNGASIVQIPLTYSGSLTGLPFSHIRNVGAGSLTVFAIDYTKDIMFIGTSIGTPETPPTYLTYYPKVSRSVPTLAISQIFKFYLLEEINTLALFFMMKISM